MTPNCCHYLKTVHPGVGAPTCAIGLNVRLCGPCPYKNAPPASVRALMMGWTPPPTCAEEHFDCLTCGQEDRSNGE